MKAGTKFILGGAVVLGIAGHVMTEAMRKTDAPPAPLPGTGLPSKAPAKLPSR